MKLLNILRWTKLFIIKIFFSQDDPVIDIICFWFDILKPVSKVAKCYRSLIVIRYDLTQSEHIKRRPLYLPLCQRCDEGMIYFQNKSRNINIFIFCFSFCPRFSKWSCKTSKRKSRKNGIRSSHRMQSLPGSSSLFWLFALPDFRFMYFSFGKY